MAIAVSFYCVQSPYVMLIGMDGAASTHSYSCGFTEQQRVPQTVSDFSYLHSEGQIVEL